MTVLDLLAGSCAIYRKTTDSSGKNTTETWSLLQSIPCRVLKNSMTKANPEKTQYSTLVRTRFVVSKTSLVAIRDRVSHAGRMYDVVEVVEATGQRQASHKVIVCEVYAGGA